MPVIRIIIPIPDRKSYPENFRSYRVKRPSPLPATSKVIRLELNKRSILENDSSGLHS